MRVTSGRTEGRGASFHEHLARLPLRLFVELKPGSPNNSHIAERRRYDPDNVFSSGPNLS
jgi:hypothetical protein